MNVQQCIRWIAVGKRARKELETEFYEARLVFGIDQVVRKMNDVAPTCADRLQCDLDILEYLFALSFEVIGAHKLASLIRSGLPRKEDVFRGLDLGYLRIRTDRTMKLLRIGHDDLGHGTYLVPYRLVSIEIHRQLS